MKVAGWSEFQHYANRRPPWIKLHRTILDNPDFMCLPVASKALAPLLWLLASESDDSGTIPALDDIAWRLRMSRKDVDVAIKPLILKGFVLDADNMLAPRKQDAMLERETERERETEEEGEREGSRKRKTNSETPERTALKAEFEIEEQRLTKNLSAIQQSGRDIQAVLDALPRSPSRSPFSASTWRRSGRSGFPTSGPALVALRLLNDALEAKQRGVKASRKGNGAPTWDRGDDSEADLDSRATEWIDAHPGATSGAPEDIAGRVSMILFAREPRQ